MSRPFPPDANYPPDMPELEMLSAYLDNALPDAERRAVEQRLSTEPALRTALESLQRTVLVLKSAPLLAPPRDFTLNPAQYRRAARRPLRSAWLTAGMIGTAAALVLVALVAVQNLTSPGRANQAVVAALPTQHPTTVVLQATSLSTTTSVAETDNTLHPIAPVPVSTATAESAAKADQVVSPARSTTRASAALPSPLPSSPATVVAANVPQATSVPSVLLAPATAEASQAGNGGAASQTGPVNSAAGVSGPGSAQAAASSVPATAPPPTMLALQPTLTAATPVPAANKVAALRDFIRWLLTLLGLKGLS